MIVPLYRGGHVPTTFSSLVISPPEMRQPRGVLSRARFLGCFGTIDGCIAADNTEVESIAHSGQAIALVNFYLI